MPMLNRSKPIIQIQIIIRMQRNLHILVIDFRGLICSNARQIYSTEATCENLSITPPVHNINPLLFPSGSFADK